MQKQPHCYIRIFALIAVIVIFAAIISCSHPTFLGRDSAATRLSNYSIYLYNKGQYAEALPVAQNALSINEEIFGTEHSYTTESLNNLALLYTNIGLFGNLRGSHLTDKNNFNFNVL